MVEDRWLTFKELMAYLKIGRSKLYRLLQDGTIPASRIGKSWRIDREEVDLWMKSQRAIPTRADLESEPPLEPEVLAVKENPFEAYPENRGSSEGRRQGETGSNAQQKERKQSDSDTT